MIAWPTGVNKTITNSSSGSGRNCLETNTMRSGKTKTRLSKSSAPKPLSIVMVFSRTEFAIFETWFETSLRYGSLTFSFPKIAGTGDAEYRIIPPYRWEQYGRDSVQVTMSWDEL